MKLFFRFLIGIATGYYWSSLHNFMNNTVINYREFFAYFYNLRFEISSISESDLTGLTTFAGIFLPIVTTETNEGSIRYTNPSVENGGIVEGISYGERGLLRRVNVGFEFKRTTQQEYEDDIVNEAFVDLNTNEGLQASYVPGGEAIVGYIGANDTDYFDDNGFVDVTKIRATPPTDQAYTPFYGNKYLRYSLSILKEVFIDQESFFNFFVVIQTIWYNGVSLQTLITLTKLLCEDYILIKSITFEDNLYRLNYSLNLESLLEDKITRQVLWLSVLEKQFLRLIPQEV